MRKREKGWQKNIWLACLLPAPVNVALSWRCVHALSMQTHNMDAVTDEASCSRMHGPYSGPWRMPCTASTSMLTIGCIGCVA